MNTLGIASLLATVFFLLGPESLQASSQSSNNANATHYHHHQQDNAKAAQYHLRSAAQSQLHHNLLEQEAKKHRHSKQKNIATPLQKIRLKSNFDRFRFKA